MFSRKFSGPLSCATDFFNLCWVDDYDSSIFGLGCHFTFGEHCDAGCATSTGRKTNLLLNTVGWILQINILDCEGELHRLDEFSLRSLREGLFDCLLDFLFHMSHPRGPRGLPLSRNP